MLIIRRQICDPNARQAPTDFLTYRSTSTTSSFQTPNTPVICTCTTKVKPSHTLTAALVIKDGYLVVNSVFMSEEHAMGSKYQDPVFVEGCVPTAKILQVCNQIWSLNH